MKEYSFRYGDGFVSLPLNEKNIEAELKGNDVPAIPDEEIRAAVYDSLNHPIDTLPLSELVDSCTNISLIVSDMTRFWSRQDKVVPHVISYLFDAGVSSDRITILISNGTHDPASEADLRTLVTDRVFETVRVINHSCTSSELTYLGTTSFGTPVCVNSIAVKSDLVICLGACTHHVMAGFGGGRKCILPGISGLETIKKNHSLSLDPDKFISNPKIGNGVLLDNPLNEDMLEAAGFMKNLFMINMVCNADMRLSSIFSGHYISSWKAGCREVNRIYQVPLHRKADVIVTSCGGFPKDESLYQGTKVIDNVCSGLNDGGKLIIMMEARNGGGSTDYFGWCDHLVNGSFEKELREHFTVGGYIFFLNCEQAKRYKIFLYTDVSPELVASMGIKAYNDLDALLKEADIGSSKIVVIENGSTVVPLVEE